MKRILPLLVLVGNVISCHASLVARVEQHAQEQAGFGAEGEFEKPVAISTSALEAIRTVRSTEELLTDCAERQGITVAAIPASWFTASEITLQQGSPSGLVVRGENVCLSGAHVAQFWVLRKSAQGYRAVFECHADSLAVLKSQTHGYHDLQLTIVTEAGASIDLMTFRYSEGKYRVAGHRVEHHNRREVRNDRKSGLQFVQMPAGTYPALAPLSSAQGVNAKNKVDVGPLWMCSTDVTVAADVRCARAGACSRDPQSRDEAKPRCAWKNNLLQHPMNCVTWQEAVQFCGWIGGRLPTSTEWEYAATSGNPGKQYAWGDDPVDASRANYCDKNCAQALGTDG